MDCAGCCVLRVNVQSWGTSGVVVDGHCCNRVLWGYAVSTMGLLQLLLAELFTCNDVCVPPLHAV